MSRVQQRQQRRAVFHTRRLWRASGRGRLMAAWSWLLAELADAERGVIERAAAQVADVARGLNRSEGRRSHDDAA